MKKIVLVTAVALALQVAPVLGFAESPAGVVAAAEAERSQSSKSAGEQLVSLDVAGVTAAELSLVLSRLSGRQIAFATADPEQLFTLEVKSVPLQEVLGQLAAHGAVVEKESSGATARGDELPEANVTIKLERVTAAEVASLFKTFLGTSGLSLEASEPGRLVTLEVKNMPLRELIPLLASTASIRLHPV